MIESILGWLGMAGTFLAYVLLTRGRVTSHSSMYLSLNVVGGILGAIGSVLYGAWPSAVSGFLWAAFSLQPLFLMRTRNASALRRGAKPLIVVWEEGKCATEGA